MTEKNDLTALTIAELRDGYAAKTFTAAEVTDAYLGEIETAGVLNAFVAVTAEKAREQAAASDQRIVAGTSGALEGVPLGIKDLFCTEGVHSQAASHILDGFKPHYESTITSQPLAGRRCDAGQTQHG